MKAKMLCTHKGWVGLAPVYVDKTNHVVVPRWPLLRWWLAIQVGVQKTLMFAMDDLDGELSVEITGELPVGTYKEIRL